MFGTAGSDTLKTARNQWFSQTITGDGGHCPCCDRWGRIYKRRLNETMARGLVWLCRAGSGDEWVDVPNRAPQWLVRSNQLASLRWWSLVERMDPDPDDDRRFSGMWRATADGRRFVAGLITVPQHAWTYDGVLQHHTGPDILISDCLEGFSYSEVMEDRPE